MASDIMEDYSVLFGKPGQDSREGNLVFATDADAKAARDERATELKAQGYKVTKATLKRQLRKYWSYGNPCGKSCDCYWLKAVKDD